MLPPLAANKQKERKPVRPKKVPRVCLPYRKWLIETYDCPVQDECEEGKHAHHHRIGTNAGTSKKPSDRWCVVLCHKHHNWGHQVGWRTFERRTGIDLKAMAEALAKASPYWPKLKEMP